MAERAWTAEQLRAIRTVDRSVLVSAGAGSGKTAVLAERCAHLVADLNPPCDVGQLLVVTFTDAAAAEMRQRIEATLRDRLAARSTDARLRRQLALIDTASISTIHAFCKRTLVRYFAHAELDPRAEQLDEHEIRQLRADSARAVCDRLADREDAAGEAFLALLEAYGNTREHWLMKQVLQVEDFLNSIVDPEGWLARVEERWIPPAGGELPPFWFELLVDALRGELAAQLVTVEHYLDELRGGSVPGADAFLKCLEPYHEALSSWQEQLGAEPTAAVVDQICSQEMIAFEFPSLPRKGRNVTDQGEEAVAAFVRMQDQLREVKEDLLKKRLRDAFGRFSIADWCEGISRTSPHVRTFLAVLRAIRKEYRDRKRDLGVLDFADLERLTLDLLLDESNGVAARLRDRYRFVLVDEFQDTNPLQAEILRLISREADGARPANLFTVGDVKQSIYRFRLAEPRLFLERQQAFPADDSDPRGRCVPLNENFRSCPRLIKAINLIFERIIAPDLGGIAYDETARLKAHRTDNRFADLPAVELHVLEADRRADGDEARKYADSEAVPSAARADERPEAGGEDAWDWERIEREAYVIARRIAAMTSAGVPYRDIVILLRSVQPHAGLLVRTLSRLGVPVFADVVGGFFESIEILDVLSVLQLLDNFRQDIPLAAVFRSPVLGEPLADEDLAAIRAWTRGSSVPFHRAVFRYARSGPDESLRSRLAQRLATLRRWRRRARLRPLAEVLWSMYEESGYFAHVSGLRDGLQRRANLLQLHEYARLFGRFNRQGLYRFLLFIDELEASETDLDVGSVAGAAQDVVRVMTIHKSKGLEFPIVIVGELGKKFNLRDAQGAILYDRHLGVALKAVDLEKRITYPTLPHRLISDSVARESRSEELRVLYVALTRARERLILVGSASLKKLDGWRARYGGRGGPLPLLERSGAVSMLDWIGAALCGIGPPTVSFGSDDGLCAIHTYSAGQMTSWQTRPPVEPEWISRLEACASFTLPPAPPLGPPERAEAELVQRRLAHVYPAAIMTKQPAVVAASAIKHRWAALQDDDQPDRAWESGRVFSFDQDATDARAAAARGTWTHEFLQRVDLAQSCDECGLRSQLEALIAAGRLQQEAAGEIDLAAIAWFLATPLGSRLRRASARVHREWPFVFGVEPSRLDPAAKADAGEIVLVRGIIDCLFNAGEGWEILDYKTDALPTPGAVEARAALYSGQLAIYAEAAAAALRQPIIRRSLVFLAPRQVIEP